MTIRETKQRSGPQPSMGRKRNEGIFLAAKEDSGRRDAQGSETNSHGTYCFPQWLQQFTLQPTV